MKKFLLLLLFVMVYNAHLPAQKKELMIEPEKLLIKVRTTDNLYRGRLYYVSDSSIWVIKRKQYGNLPEILPVPHIELITFKRKNAFLNGMLEGFGVGLFLGFFIPAKIFEYAPIPHADEVIAYCTLGGAGLGFVLGSLLGPSVKISIAINKSQELFVNNRQRLKSLVYERK